MAITRKRTPRQTIILTSELSAQIEQEWPVRVTPHRLARTALRIGLQILENYDAAQFNEAIVQDLAEGRR